MSEYWDLGMRPAGGGEPGSVGPQFVHHPRSYRPELGATVFEHLWPPFDHHLTMTGAQGPAGRSGASRPGRVPRLQPELLPRNL